jgi:hypothetical protein
MEENDMPAKWEKYGLGTLHSGSLTVQEWVRTARGHNLVANYLDSHPEIAAQYKPDQTGQIKYFDVLRLAEEEERGEIPEQVDLEKMYYAQRIRAIVPYFCDECGATNPKHGFYPLGHSHTVWNGEWLVSPSGVTCNCCHATPENRCPYCAEEEKTGKSID